MAGFIAAMCAVVAASNHLVQFPVQVTVGGYDFADLLTWGAFTYPVAFLVTDLTNRRFGPSAARIVVFAGFALAVLLSVVLATPRIAIASGTAFLAAQLLDVAVFNRLRERQWWQAPLISSVLGSVLDTFIFFTLAFAPAFAMLGANDAFAIETSALLGLFATEAPRWVSWALGDLGVKLLVGLAMLVPYGLLLSVSGPRRLAAD
ncbi:MAG: queuosine precursor transporter [Roseitalea sp.]|nr:queuosine precursor transporter [Roseitalea sp.]MBO6720942.1 queuosine precursor transporter [Roseitalea sp.]MBO6743247.1 queuosine precursor transporter [Roseitalea sp.]